jgi:hypothetical protein
VNADCRPDRNGVRTRSTAASGLRQQRQRSELSWEERFFEEYTPPQIIPNRYVLIAAIILAIGLAWYSASMRGGLR